MQKEMRLVDLIRIMGKWDPKINLEVNTKKEYGQITIGITFSSEQLPLSQINNELENSYRVKDKDIELAMSGDQKTKKKYHYPNEYHIKKKLERAKKAIDEAMKKYV